MFIWYQINRLPSYSAKVSIKMTLTSTTAFVSKYSTNKKVDNLFRWFKCFSHFDSSPALLQPMQYVVIRLLLRLAYILHPPSSKCRMALVPDV